MKKLNLVYLCLFFFSACLPVIVGQKQASTPLGSSENDQSAYTKGYVYILEFMRTKYGAANEYMKHLDCY